jgi:tRNA-dihydrouridine synthase A
MTKPSKKPNRTVSVAPMMGWTDRHDRYFLRLISPNALLYTVMITTGALIYGKKHDILEYNSEENPLALQLGGSDPKDLAESCRIAARYGYDEINLNCGCPSDRVQKGQFGACLMAHPALVAECIDAMQQAVPDIPVTVKTRIGIDDQDSYEFLTDFVGKIADKGCKTFIIHARKAWLNGLSPAENRSVPPLDWERAYRLKKDFPDLEIILNGGIKTVAHIQEALQHVDGVMIGREAYTNPYFLAEIEKEIFKNQNVLSRDQVIESIIPYADRIARENIPVKDITRHILGLYQGLPGARRWRQILSQEAYKPAANSDVIRQAMAAISKG